MISAYIGTEPVASKLVEMTKQQEFIFGGFSTGIATLSDGRIARRRTVGSLSTFVTRELQNPMPGNIGISHSRTDDGGGVEWSQPRLDHLESIASVGVGIGGVFPRDGSTTRLAKELLEAGAIFRTRSTEGKKNAISLPDDSVVHAGEVYLLGLSREYLRTKSLLTAIRSLNLRSESAGMYLCRDQPERVFISNHNQRIIIGRLGEDILIATSHLAFPSPLKWSMEMPMNSFASISRENVSIEVLWEVEDLFDTTEPTDAAARFLDFVAKNPGSTWFETVCGSIDPILPRDKATKSSIIGHRLLEQLLHEGTLRFEVRKTVGRDGQTDIPVMTLFRNL